MVKSNNEKQARFRKKEALKRRAEQIFKEIQLGMLILSDTRTNQEIQFNLDKITDLPNDWTDEDYNRAYLNLERFRDDFRFSKQLLANDVQQTICTTEKFMTSPDPSKIIKEEKEAVAKTKELAFHIISALKLSSCSDSDKAAALMEAVRFLGRILIIDKEVPRSNATTICLASIGPGYERPEWFVESLTETLAWQIGKETAHEVGNKLQKFEYK